MTKKRPPMLACNRCGRPAYYEIEMNRRCGLMTAGKQCRGRIRFVQRADWAQCSSCDATGWTGGTCSNCSGVGWIIRRKHTASPGLLWGIFAS
jgi:DnaJ-class molecular chaperone